MKIRMIDMSDSAWFNIVVGFHSRVGESSPFTQQFLDWVKEYNLDIRYQGTKREINNEPESTIDLNIHEITNSIFSLTFADKDLLIFKSKDDAMLFKLAWG